MYLIDHVYCHFLVLPILAPLKREKKLYLQDEPLLCQGQHYTDGKDRKNLKEWLKDHLHIASSLIAVQKVNVKHFYLTWPEVFLPLIGMRHSHELLKQSSLKQLDETWPQSSIGILLNCTLLCFQPSLQL